MEAAAELVEDSDDAVGDAEPEELVVPPEQPAIDRSNAPAVRYKRPLLQCFFFMESIHLLLF